MTSPFEDVMAYDTVVVTGRITSEPGRPRVVNLRGVVATVSRDDDPKEDAVKVWPEKDGDPQLPDGHDGKLWFTAESVEEITVVARDAEVQPPGRMFVKPGCCSGSDSGAVFLAWRGRNSGAGPSWRARSPGHFGYECGDAEVSFCPFCGKKLPALVRRERPPKRVRSVTDGGYYCDTCGERLNCCPCWPEEWLWRPSEESDSGTATSDPDTFLGVGHSTQSLGGNDS